MRVIGFIRYVCLELALGTINPAFAVNECGRPEGALPINCSPSNYDASRDGNVVYDLDGTREEDFSIHLSENLLIRYDRNNSGDDRLLFPISGDPLYSAVRIETDAGYKGDISFSSSADITSNARGISVAHYGRTGALRTEVSGGSFSITSDWNRAFAIHSYRSEEYDTEDEFSGDQDVIVRSTAVDLDGAAWGGVVGSQGVRGHLNVTVQDSSIKIDAPRATGILSTHRNTGDVGINIRDVDIKVRGAGSVDGILGYHFGTGDTDISLRDVDIETQGNEYSNGIAYIYLGNDGLGTLAIDARDIGIRVHGERYLDGVFGIHRGTGDIKTSIRRGTIVTNGADSGGLAFVHDGIGDINIAARNVDIKVQGDRSVGIGGGQRYESRGDIAIDVRDSTVSVTGESVAGIRSFHMSGEGRIAVRVDGGKITADGLNSSGILVGLTGRIFGERTGPIKSPAGGQIAMSGGGLNDRPSAKRAAQSVFVGGRVRGGTGMGAGVRLYGGGRVEVGSQGSVGAHSGVAIRSEGDNAALHVDLKLDGRRVSDVIMGEIRNNDGSTTVAVNGVVLHDGMTGATGRWAPNGARDISLAASETVVGRAFMPSTFVTSPYAPRAAVYEALPGFILRLDNPGAAAQRWRRPDSPVWIGVLTGRGSYKPYHSQTGAAFDSSRFEFESGVEFGLFGEENVTGMISVRRVQGSADVTARTGGGKIEAAGFGASVGVSWENINGHYVSGRFSVARYDTDLRADGRGPLKEHAGATARNFRIEAGRYFLLTENFSLISQSWLTHSNLSMDGFRDAVGSRVSLVEANLSTAGLGIVTESVHSWGDGERKLALRGHLAVEQVLRDAKTVVDVSGERLGSSESHRTRGMLGLSAVYHWNQWALGGAVSASGLGSDDSSYAISASLGIQF